MADVADRHIRPGWVRTIHSAQGATADQVIAHLESFRPNTVDAPAVYVAISRADLTAALGIRTGKQIGALDEVWGRDPPPIAMPQPTMMAGMAISSSL